ncbi:hypothetical protein AB0Y20_18685 [Heyndrickxia oleronia]|jgi:hypothetical protein|uniref:hypothetical protein n=1 Tax=Heyndrickxia oleronia TaxID=38875 RepID=UPI003F245273
MEAAGNMEKAANITEQEFKEVPGISNVSSANISDYRKAIGTGELMNFNTPEKIQSMIDNINAAVDRVNTILSGKAWNIRFADPTVTDNKSDAVSTYIHIPKANDVIGATLSYVVGPNSIFINILPPIGTDITGQSIWITRENSFGNSEVVLTVTDNIQPIVQRTKLIQVKAIAGSTGFFIIYQ